MKQMVSITLEPDLQAALAARQNGYPNLAMTARAILCEALGLPLPLTREERDAARRELLALVTNGDRATLDAVLAAARQGRE